MSTLAAIILCRDELDHLEPCLESAAFADEVLVFADGSSPVLAQVQQIAVQAGARVVERVFDDYASQRNAALQAVQTDWVLFIDADERVTPELAAEVREVIAGDKVAGYGIPRHNYIFGRLTRHTGWYPDYQTRLLCRTKAHYDPARPVHEVVILDGPESQLRAPFIHYNYRDLSQFLTKQRRYAAIDAGILYEQGVRPSLRKTITHPLRHFYWRFVTLAGYRDGLHGLRLSLLMAWYEWLKLRQLAARWNTRSG